MRVGCRLLFLITLLYWDLCSRRWLTMFGVWSVCISLVLILWGTSEKVQGKASKLWLQPLNETFLQTGVFPSGILWGVGTAAFPTEGSWDADGKGESVWDRFTRHTDPSSNSYIRGGGSGVSSVSSPAGVQHYRRLIGKLKELQVEPVVTLFHWDLPQVLQERFGGWLNRSTADVFADYAAFCFRTFGAEVRYWITMHNPFLLAVQGYGTGAHAPGVTGDPADPFIAAHNLLRAHAKAWHLYDKHFRRHQRGNVSITLGSHWVEPLHGQAMPTNLELCQKAMEAVIGWFAEPIYGSGDYPESLKASHRGVIPEFSAQERLWIKGTADFFSLAFGPETLRVGQGLARFGQTVKLDLRSVLVWVQQTYSDPQLLLAESGWFTDASVGVQDTKAIYLMKRFIMQVMQAVSVDGVCVFGYTAWTLLDGFEWNHGYSIRRGLFYIDFSEPERRRLPKTSAHFYRRLVRDNGFPAENTPHIEGRLPCDFQFGVSESVLQFTDPQLYRWNLSGDGALSPVMGILLHTRPVQCTDFLFIQRHLFLLGVTGSAHYRFALDWTQLSPGGDPEKVRFYRCVLMELQHRGIQPVVTLYHPSYHSPSLGLPEALHANGGWRNASAVEAFVSYAAFCFHKFGDFVSTWITINEPNRLTEAYTEDRKTVARNMLLAHAKAWRIYDERFRQKQGGGGAVSLAIHADWVEPANPFLESHKSAQQQFLAFEVGRFLDPLIGNEGRGNGFSNAERAELKGALDFIALNHFTTRLVAPWENAKPQKPEHGCALMTDVTWPASHLRQALVPWGLRRMLGWVDDQAFHDDQLRQSYIRSYLQEALKGERSLNVFLYILYF
uniref:Beta-klotho-like n=1 Tax=Sinocyclocheilus rhinocerous TaxID=307959 RepID=A0A673JGG8_9TELE